MELIKFIFSSFWIFAGVLVLGNGVMYFIINMIIRMWSRFMRYLMVKKHGWPPSHLDADGDSVESCA